MRTRLVLLSVLVFLAFSAAAFADVSGFSQSLATPKGLMALPAVPLDPAPGVVFGTVPIHYNLTRWNADTQSWVTYNKFSPGLFGNMLIGEGYWMKTGSSGLGVDYQGLTDTDTMDIWISLPKAGWNLIGNPFSFDYTWANAKVTDGNETVSLATARAAPRQWLVTKMNWWNEATQGWATVGIPADIFYTTAVLHPWHGYYLKTNPGHDKLALILESPL